MYVRILCLVIRMDDVLVPVLFECGTQREANDMDYWHSLDNTPQRNISCRFTSRYNSPGGFQQQTNNRFTA